MPTTHPVRVGLIGAGLMARYHLGDMLAREDTEVAALCEPSEASFGIAARAFTERGLAVPPNEPDWERFVERFVPQLDAVAIITPHVFHSAQATVCLEAGLDVLLEKPMVVDAAEAEALIATRDRTGRLLVVAFTGSLSPQVRAAARMIASGKLGELLNVDARRLAGLADAHERDVAPGPRDVGGGFLFDTGAHMLNTVADIAAPTSSRSPRGWSTTAARSTSGRSSSPGSLGRARDDERVRSRVVVRSHIRRVCERATLRTGSGATPRSPAEWRTRLSPVRSVKSRPVWEQFLAVAAGASRTRARRRSAPDGPAVGRDPQLSARGGAVVRPGVPA